jgi:hypothetical protein
VYEKYNHAIGCFPSAGSIPRQANKAALHVGYTIPHFGPVEVAFNLNSRIIAPLWFVTIGSNSSFLQSCGWYAGIIYFIGRSIVGVKRKHPGEMTQFAKFATAAINDKSIANWPFEVRLTKYRKSVDFTSVGQQVARKPILVKYVYEMMREKKFIER